MMSSNLLRSSSLFCQCNFQRQVELIPGYYALLDQLIAAFGDLLIGLFSVFQTIWISDRDRGYKFLQRCGAHRKNARMPPGWLREGGTERIQSIFEKLWNGLTEFGGEINMFHDDDLLLDLVCYCCIAFFVKTGVQVGLELVLHRRLVALHSKTWVWLNIAECELSVFDRQCLARRIADKPTLVAEVEAWKTTRNDAGQSATGNSRPKTPEPNSRNFTLK